MDTLTGATEHVLPRKRRVPAIMVRVLVALAILASGLIATAPRASADYLATDTWIAGAYGGFHIVVYNRGGSWQIAIDDYHDADQTFYVGVAQAWLVDDMMNYYFVSGNQQGGLGRMVMCWKGGGPYGVRHGLDQSSYYAWRQVDVNSGATIDYSGYYHYDTRLLGRSDVGNNCAAIDLW